MLALWPRLWVRNLAAIEEIAKEAEQGEICTAANDNADGQVVISGHKGAVERAMEIAKERGIKRAIPLPVSAPFHCPLMQPAADEMAVALAETTFNAPCVPVITNVSADAVQRPGSFKARNWLSRLRGAFAGAKAVLRMGDLGVTAS